MIETLKIDEFEQVVFFSDPRVGLKAIVAMHSTALGPAVGGCRMWAYKDDQEALSDVLRLSKGMTYKASVAGLNWGGGKAILVGDSKAAKTPAMLERFGEYVDRLGGHYVTAKDVGIGSDDLRTVKRRTRHVLGIDGESGSSGDPSPATGFGVYHGLKSAAAHGLGASSLKGVRVAVQGLGSVAYYLMQYLHRDGAKIIGCDIDPAVVERAKKEFGIEVVSPDAIYDVDCDVFSPNALGATINARTLPRIKARVIAGGANNQLATTADGDALHARGLTYAPDYVINGGGLINIYYERADEGGYNKQRAFSHVERIGQTITDILKRSKTENAPAYLVADRIAEERVNAARPRK